MTRGFPSLQVGDQLKVGGFVLLRPKGRSFRECARARFCLEGTLSFGGGQWLGLQIVSQARELGETTAEIADGFAVLAGFSGGGLGFVPLFLGCPRFAT